MEAAERALKYFELWTEADDGLKKKAQTEDDDPYTTIAKCREEVSHSELVTSSFSSFVLCFQISHSLE